MKYPYHAFREEVEEQVRNTLGKLYGIEDEIKLEKPTGIADLAFPCFSLSKIVKKNPLEIAEEIARNIETKKWIERVKAINGYVNFFINMNKMAMETVKAIMEMRDDYGSLEDKKIKVIVEHTSANPNGPLHVGRARNPIIGE